MGILSIFKKKEEKNQGDNFTDADRLRGSMQSAKIRRMKSEIKKAEEEIKLKELMIQLEDKQAELDELRGMEEEEETQTSPDQLLMQLFSKAIPGIAPGSNTTTESGQSVAPSKAELLLGAINNMDEKQFTKLADNLEKLTK